MKNEKPILFSTPMVKAILNGRKTQTRRVIKPQPDGINMEWQINTLLKKCPYKKGMKLWVRETWAEGIIYDCVYKASYEYDNLVKWKPSIFMPKKYARIWLEVTGVRIEKIQDITEEDAKAEGVFMDIDCICNPISYYTSFAKLWDSINAKRGYSWESNCWVYVIEFKRIK